MKRLMIMISLSQLMLMDCSYAPLELSVQDVLVIFSVSATLFGTIFSHSFNRDKCISHNAITSVPALANFHPIGNTFLSFPFILVATQVATSSHYLPPAMPYLLWYWLISVSMQSIIYVLPETKRL